MSDDKLIWPARLHHLNLTSEDPEALVAWYSKALMMEPKGTAMGETWLSGKDRHLIISDGPKGGLTYAAYALEIEAQLMRLRNHICEKDIAVYPSPSPLMEDGAFMITDQDGNNVEISAEIEHWTFEQEPREWLHEQRTLNLWGAAWLRS